MSITSETVIDVMEAWNNHRLGLISEGNENPSMNVLESSIWMDRLFQAHLREGKAKPRPGRKPREVVPANDGPQAVE